MSEIKQVAADALSHRYEMVMAEATAAIATALEAQGKEQTEAFGLAAELAARAMGAKAMERALLEGAPQEGSEP